MQWNKIWNKENFLILSWALYDTANQFFALNVVSVYFPRWLTEAKDMSVIFYGFAYGGSMILVAVIAPILGTISDFQNRKKHYLVVFTMTCVVSIFFISATQNALLGLIFFALANCGYQLAAVFYNALLPRVARKEKIGFVSGFGRMFAYSGALIAMLLSKPIIARYGYQWTFRATAMAFLFFALPAMIFIREKDYARDKPLLSFLNKEGITPVFQRIKDVWSGAAEFRTVRLFLFMFFWGMCAYQTVVIFLAVYAGEVFGLNEQAIINLIFISAVFAVLASLTAGFLADRFGHKRMMKIIFGLWTCSFIFGAFLHPPFHWLIGPLIGITLSSTGVVGRAWLVRLIPREKIGEVFGLYNVMGYIAGVAGPLLWSAVLWMMSPLGVWRYRISLLSLTIFIVVAYMFFKNIPEVSNEEQYTK
jgi:UMF1 family MFS transporter